MTGPLGRGAVGGFFLVMIPVRRAMAKRAWRVRLWQLGVAGAVVGFLTGRGDSHHEVARDRFVVATRVGVGRAGRLVVRANRAAQEPQRCGGAVPSEGGVTRAHVGLVIPQIPRKGA